MIQRGLYRQSKAFASTCIASSTRPRLIPSPPVRILRSADLSALGSRWYSASTDDAVSDTTSAAAKSQVAPKEAVDPQQAELETKNREIIELKDRYLRSVADFRNLQERTKREVASARDFALQRFAKDLIDSVDNLDRALQTVPVDILGKADSNKDLESLYGGLKMTEGILMSTLQKHGLERFDPSETGERFDPNKHEATFMTKVEGKEDGTAFQTIQKGFTLNGRVIRAAKVGVVKNS